MKSITEILGGSQILLDISYDIRDVFEDYLTDTHRLSLSALRVIESALPILNENRAGTGREPYALTSIIRAPFEAKEYREKLMAERRQRYQDDVDRIAVEGRIGVAKRKSGQNLFS